MNNGVNDVAFLCCSRTVEKVGMWRHLVVCTHLVKLRQPFLYPAVFAALDEIAE